ncbi:phosphotyrosine protein phosphatase [Qipengyuania nanhaisediminis]
MAEGALRAAAEEAGLDLRVDSAGTANYHVGDPPDPRAIAATARAGVDIAHLRGRQLCKEDFFAFTDIFALDAANLADIRARMPADATARVSLLLEAAHGQPAEVSDPYYGDDAGFSACWDEVNHAAKALVTRYAR